MNYCLVTGSAGFIGSHLVDALLAKGHRVDGVDDLTIGRHTTQHERYQFFHARDADVRWFDRRGWDTVFHCAAHARIQQSFGHPRYVINNNVHGTVAMLDVAREEGAKFIYAGSSTCDGDVYANPYAFSKHLGEEACDLYAKLYDVPCAIARFYNVYGPRQIEEGDYATAMGIWEKAYREGRPLPMCGTGEKRRDWTHVEDIVSGLIAIEKWLTQGLVTFHLGRGEDLSVAEVLAMFGGEIKRLPDRPGEAQKTLADNTTARALGWEPKWRIEDYIRAVKGAEVNAA